VPVLRVFVKDRRNANEEEIMAEPSIEELKAEIEKLKAQKVKTGDLSFKVSEKGAVSVYGLGRFPVTLYQEQWVRLLGVAEDLKTFIKENSAKLKVKE
jgi:hypothetical protein